MQLNENSYEDYHLNMIELHRIGYPLSKGKLLQNCLILLVMKGYKNATLIISV